MGKASRDKGGRFERELVNTARAHSLDAFRVPLSGAADGFKNDVIIKSGRETWELEAKKRASGLKMIKPPCTTAPAGQRRNVFASSAAKNSCHSGK